MKVNRMKKLQLSEVKQIELDILKNFAAFCNEHNLNYVLAYGTLLGCIRHNGFIPWDDDIDVFMLRDDYEKLLSMKNLFEGKFSKLKFKNLGDKDYPFGFLKITDDTTRVEEKEIEAKYQYGIWIDVFPLDKVSSGEKKHIKNWRKINFWNKILIKSIIKSGNIGTTIIQKKINSLLLIPVAHCVGHIIKISKKCNRLAQKFNNEETSLVSNYIWENNPRNQPVFEKERLFPAIKGFFEGVEFCIPNDSDGILKKMYGNYMQLPPESERVSHLANAWSY